MIESIRKHYIANRTRLVDRDFLEFEETQSSKEDQETILGLLSRQRTDQVKLENKHNSILLYLTGLTDKFDFVQGRSDTIGGAPPDVDLDFDPLGRDDLIAWTVNRWGRDNVANITAHGTFKPKSIARKWFTATGEDPTVLREILDMIPPAEFGKEATLSEVVEKNPKLASEKRFRKFYEHAQKIEDMVSHFTVHAAGLVISDRPIYETIPVYATGKNERITQFNKDEVEALGLLKYDYLVIENLSVLKEIHRLVKQRHGVDINLSDIQDGDQKTYELLANGMVTGVFQCEAGSAAKDYIHKLKPNSIEMLSDISALNRPGPQSSGLDQQYIQQRQDGYASNGLPECVNEILKSTYWTLVYQEQCMEIASKIAGFSLQKADDLRRAMGKKDDEKMAKLKDIFLDGCKQVNLVSSSEAEALWNLLEKYSDYGFNKSHAVAYAHITYWCAWFKANYPTEFFAGLMTVRSQTLQPKDWAVKAADYISEARTLGVKIVPPNINTSEIGFGIHGDEISFGLNGIRDVGATGAESIMYARGNQPFKSVVDFLERVNNRKVTTKVFAALVRAGAFDRMGYSRESLLDNSDDLFGYVRGIVEYEERKLAVEARKIEVERVEVLAAERDRLRLLEKKKQPLSTEEQEFLSQHEKLRRPIQLKLGDPPVEPTIERTSRVAVTLEQIMEQANYIGCYISHHPAKMMNVLTNDLCHLIPGDNAVVKGVVLQSKEITTKRGGQKMAFVQIDDSTGAAELIVFPSTWERCKPINVGDLIIVEGSVENSEELKIKVRKVEFYRRNE